MAYVTADELQQLRQLRREQDRRAMAIGVAVLQLFEQVRQTALDVGKGEADQRRVGEQVLRAHGFNPDIDDLTIDLMTGEIKRLVAGAWAPTE